jgi:hypothetical protein
LQYAPYRSLDVFGREPEVLEQVRRGRRLAEAVDADDRPVASEST